MLYWWNQGKEERAAIWWLFTRFPTVLIHFLDNKILKIKERKGIVCYGLYFFLCAAYYFATTIYCAALYLLWVYFGSRTTVPALLVPCTIFSTSEIIMIDISDLCHCCDFYLMSHQESLIQWSRAYVICTNAGQMVSPRNSRLSSYFNIANKSLLIDHHGILWFWSGF